MARLSDLQKRIIENAQRYDRSIGFLSGDIARALREPQRTIITNLAILEKVGKVTHRGPTWYLTK